MIELSFIISFIVIFLHACTREGRIFDFIPELLWKAPEWIKKPLFDCIVCMVPWWGSLFLFISCYRAQSWLDWFSWLTILAVAGGINAILDSLIETNATERLPASNN